MKIKKQNNTYNTYSVEISWGQLMGIKDALENDHADPVKDEMYQEISWYMENVAGPGEDEDEFKANKDAEKEAETEEGEVQDTSSVGEEVSISSGPDAKGSVSTFDNIDDLDRAGSYEETAVDTEADELLPAAEF